MQREEKAQKLGRRNTYTPTGTAPACSNCDLSLKVLRGRNGVADLKTLPSNPEEHQHSGKSVQDLRVPVLNMHIEYGCMERVRERIEEVKKAISPTTEVVGLLALS